MVLDVYSASYPAHFVTKWSENLFIPTALLRYMTFLEMGAFWLIIYAYFGLILGYFLKKITKEELSPGENYFRKSGMALMLVIGFLSLIIFSSGFNRDMGALFALGLVVGMVLRTPYPVFALGLAFAVGRFGLILASLVFIFGLIDSSLKWGRSLLVETFMYFLLPALVIVYYDLNFVNEFLILAFVSGFCFSYAYKVLTRE